MDIKAPPRDDLRDAFHCSYSVVSVLRIDELFVHEGKERILLLSLILSHLGNEPER